MPATTYPRRAQLARILTGLRVIAGHTFAQLAARTVELDDVVTLSATTLKRAADGTTVLREDTVTAYVRACGASPEDEHAALRWWRAARGEERGILTRLQAPGVRNIRSRADLTAALAAAYERAGAPPLRTLQQRAKTGSTKGASLLPLTTAWRITRREAQPADWSQCVAFLRGCGITPPAWATGSTPGPVPRRPRRPRAASQPAAKPAVCPARACSPTSPTASTELAQKS